MARKRAGGQVRSMNGAQPTITIDRVCNTGQDFSCKNKCHTIVQEEANGNNSLAYG